MIVKVLDKHIKAGKQNDCWKCPVALAGKEVFAADLCCVRRSKIYIFKNFPNETISLKNYELPQNAIDTYGYFDLTGKMEPFIFEVNNNL